MSYARVLRRGWWIVLLVLTACLAASALVTSRQAPVYRASTTLVVTPNTDVEGTADILRSLDTLERRSVIATFARIPPIPETRSAAAIRMGREAAELTRYWIEASVLPNTNIVKIDVEGPDGYVAASVANAVAGVTREEARRLYRIFTLKTLAEAVPASTPAYPEPRRNYAVAGILGLFLGAGAAFVAERVRAPGPRTT
jgi:capsular polysaccharide biosynthesis protein